MIENIFPIKIYKTRYDGDLKSLQDSIITNLIDVFVDTENNNQGSMRNGGLCSYNVRRNLHIEPELQPYVEFLKKHLNGYWSQLSYIGKPKIFEMWANRYTKDSFIDSHNHSPIPLTSSFYLKKDYNTGNLVFEHPNETVLKHQPYNLENRDIYHLLFNHEVEVDEGDLIIFPSWLNHKTTPNRSGGDRIIIGTNILAEKQ